MVWKLSAAPAKYSLLYASGELLCEIRRTNRKWKGLALIFNLNTPSAHPVFYTHISRRKMIITYVLSYQSKHTLDSYAKFEIFILVINQLDAQNLYYNKFISCLYMFRAPCAHRQGVKIVLYSLWYHHTLVG